MWTRSGRALALLVAGMFCAGARASAADSQGQLADPIKIDSGLVSGVAVGEKKDVPRSSELERGVRVYKGIPFAAPPVGPLRWKPPQPVKAWDGVKTCAEFGPACPQPKPFIGQVPSKVSEDCLYLNIWTAARKSGENRPVMVWIHGGSYVSGSGAHPAYDGEALARQGVVVVTINYRLGPFGFFAHPLLSNESERKVSGNYGLLDQIAALQWVKRNTAAFGGNPDCVTIFGQSAGGGSVCFLLISPLAKGLFQRAIAESGSAYGLRRHLRETRWGFDPLEKVGERIAKTLGCDKEKDVLAALRAKTPDEIIKAANPMVGVFSSGTRLSPVVDGWVIPEEAPTLFESGKYNDVPLMIGTTADEVTIYLREFQAKDLAGYRKLLKLYFRERAAEVEALFPAANDAEVPYAINRVMTDYTFVAPTRSVVRAMSRGRSKAFLYHFTCVPPYANPRKLGAYHSAEIPYVFNNTSGFNGVVDKDKALARTMSACWARFAATGDPNGEGLPAWPAYDTKTDEHLEFNDEEIKVGSGLHKKACDLFDQILRERLAKQR
jgi:para-nitrobenzyl esterase